MALQAGDIVPSANQESAHVIVAVTADATTTEIEMEVHPVLVARCVVVETGPGARWKLIVAHIGCLNLLLRSVKMPPAGNVGLGKLLCSFPQRSLLKMPP